ncbi:hypothetical protein [Maribacter sp. 2307UL18-2]|uniref:hypothetical protein n=1 Tax=Maribacter sp. 2307UL18-2 TaxID=3386274 RepID=UPI0039BD6B71
MNQSRIKPTIWFWVLAVLGLLWNLIGVYFYLIEAYMKDEMRATLSDAQRAIFETQPVWLTAAYALAVFGGALGCIGLLVRKKWATPLFLLSLVALIARTCYYFFMTNATEVFDMVQGTILPIAVIIIGALLYIFSKIAADRRWIT